jgi:hypothetical protein
MTTTPELDRAINAADHKVKELYDQKQKRRHARALIADLLRDMDEPPLDQPAILGWDLAITVIKRRAGLEGEG